MNIEFHYYAVYALALEAGFDDSSAFTIANASQEVDASTSPLAFDAPRGVIDIAVTQNYLFWDESVKRDVYLPFHFLPGDPAAAGAARADGVSARYAVTPNSPIAKSLLVAALKDKDLFLIGVAAHSFADTWAHQNFSGLLDSVNDLDPRGRLRESRAGGLRQGLRQAGLSPSGLPPAGHLQALSAPDEPDAVWLDPRLRPDLERVVNRERFSAAARKLFRYFRVYLGRPFGDDELVAARLEAIWRKASRSERLSDYVICWNLRPYEPGLWRARAGARPSDSPLSSLRHYDKLAWAKGELLRAAGAPRAHPVPADASIYGSELYRWNEAAKEHRARAQALIERIP